MKQPDPIEIIVQNEKLSKEELSQKQKLYAKYFDLVQRAAFLREQHSEAQDAQKNADDGYSLLDALNAAERAENAAENAAERAYREYSDYAPELSSVEKEWRAVLLEIGSSVGGTSSADRTPEQLAEYNRLLDEFFERMVLKEEQLDKVPLVRRTAVGFVVGLTDENFLFFMDVWKMELFVKQALDRLPADFIERYKNRSPHEKAASLKREQSAAEMFIAELGLDGDTFMDDFYKTDQQEKHKGEEN